MKRISLLSIVVLISIPLTVQARNSSYFRNRVRWSMHKQGLISGNVKYSPYAFQYGSTGLVHGNTRYTPYALSYGSSGLVVDPGCTHYRYCHYRNPQVYVVVKNSSINSSCTSAANYSTKTKNNYKAKVIASNTSVKQQKSNLEKIQQERKNDPAQIIRAYLKSKDIDFRTNRSLRIDKKTISIDFILKDTNITIKYWNAEEILALVKQDNYKKKHFENYVVSWKAQSDDYINAGGNIYQIISSDNKDILAQLELNNELNHPERMYAFVQNNSSNVGNP